MSKSYAIFIGASYERLEEARRLAAALRAAGHRVVSRWHLLEPAAYTHTAELLTEFALMDVDDLNRANAYAGITGDSPAQRCRGGRNCSLGGALFTGKRVAILGPRENEFHWHPAVRVTKSIEELLEVFAS